ncbi:hypothetical protein DFP94_106141 [Fontibacillus phaseoli]|uniref:Uncharacterized protein n=1 Tax=Fontibacillus phaseoli TaxID=1416533 RepID=A0A369BDR6_9BACL|nr:hypothetical protein DFP94_106141 [Fontibacillus phaseoli]
MTLQERFGDWEGTHSSWHCNNRYIGQPPGQVVVVSRESDSEMPSFIGVLQLYSYQGLALLTAFLIS